MKKYIANLILFVFLVSLITSCTSYSTTTRPEAENIINAPVDIVWEKTLVILPSERVSLLSVNKSDYFISGRKHITFWSWGDDISVHLIPKGENTTIMHFSAGARAQAIDWGHEERMTEHIFNKIKIASENEAISATQ